MQRALVIGGTGFVGLAVVDALIASGIQVRVTRRKRSITALVRKRNVELVPASLEDGCTLEAAMRGADAVFLTAGHYPRYSLDRDATIELGVQGIRNACEAALRVGVPRVVYTSSTGALDTCPNLSMATENDVPAHIPHESIYRSVKWAMEREVERFERRGLSVVTMIPGACMGPGDLRVGTGGILVGLVRGQIPWYVEGVVPVVDVEDVALAHVAAAQLHSPENRYCVGGHAVHVGEFLQTIVNRFGGRFPGTELGPEAARKRSSAEEIEAAPSRARVPVPREFVDLALAGRPVSNARAERDLGLAIRPLEQTLDRSHAWFSRHGFLESRKVKEAS